MSDDKPFLTISDLAELLDVPVNTVYDWRRKRTGPPSIKVGNHVRYRRREVEKWINEHVELGA